MIKQINYPASLPIVEMKELIIQTIRSHQVVVVAGDTGSGKSTQLAKMCLEAGRGKDKRIGCTQPRRLAATSVATRVAEEMGESGAALIGYKIRFSDQTSSATRIKFMTDGILLAEARRDRQLNEYDTIIVDEAHERSLNIDFLLGILRKLIDSRPDLKIIITSATIDTTKFSKAFKDAPVIEVAGRTYPVEVRYLPLEDDVDTGGYIDQAVQAAMELRRTDRHGDMLIFMPSERDIRETVELLSKAAANLRDPAGRQIMDNTTILPLFGRLSRGDQNRIFRPVQGQKIVVATNVAETSITVPGIRYVIDTGLARISTYNPRARTSKLPIVPVSRASADQRKGRCGRVAPGICLRLFAEEDYEKREEYTLPEIQRANLAEVILRMIHLKLGDPAGFPFIDPPLPRAIRDGYKLLEELDAIAVQGGDYRNCRLTNHGRLMAHLPLDPCIARMIIEARDRNCLKEVVIIAAGLSIADPRVRPADKEAEADAAQALFRDEHSDFLSYVRIWQTAEKLTSQSRLRKFCAGHYLSFQRLREWRDIHEQIQLILAEEKGFVLNESPASFEAVHCAILSGLLRNIGLKKQKNLYQGGMGKELMVFPGSGLFNRAGKWIMAAELVETTRLFARCVAEIRVEWVEPLAGPLCRKTYSSPHWEKKQGQVVALESVTLFGLPIVANRRIDYGRINKEEARQIFIQSALVEEELPGSYEFFEHNQRLIEQLKEMEERVRQRDILVDDQTLNAFYDERLDREVYDRQSLNRILKKRRGGDFLKMSEADIVRNRPDPAALEDFPNRMGAGELTFKLDYHFSPGTEEDGVNVMVPMNLIDQVTPEYFEWLVPGLLQEKITYLLKGLPKNLRRQLVPVPETARRLTDLLKGRSGSFYGALQEEVLRCCNLRVTRKDWPPEENLPAHLRFRFCLMDQEKIIKSGLELDALKMERQTGGQQISSLAAEQRQWEKVGVTADDLENLPERMPLYEKDGHLAGFAFSGLVVEADQVCLRLTIDQEESRRQTVLGLVALYGGSFPKFAKLTREFAIPAAFWALYEGIASHKDFNSALQGFVLREIFQAGSGIIPDRKTFEERLALVRDQGFIALGRALVDKVVEVLQARRAALDLISRYEGMSTGVPWRERAEYFRGEVRKLVPADFFTGLDTARLSNLPRYLKALQVRIERAHADPAKDGAKAELMVRQEARLGEACENIRPGPDGKAALREFRNMLEEYKVSLFAQEIKTAFPVSEKRLTAKWRELEQWLLPSRNMR